MSARDESATWGRATAAALFLGTLLLFARAIPHEFVNYDDPDYVTANAHVRGGLTADGVRWAFTSGDISYWHPLTWLSHMADWELFGANPHGHHATSIVWHALNAVLAFLVLRRLTGARWTSALAAALFAWHPLRVESVAWVAERKDVLSGFFWLATLWAYAAYVERRRAGAPGAAWRYVLALGAFAAGLMSKPMLVSLPVVLLVLDFWPLRRTATESGWRLALEKVPFAMLSVAVSIVTVIAQKRVGTLSEVLALDARLANAALSVARYIGKFFVPFDLAVLYPHPGYWPATRVAGAVALIVAVSAVAWWQRNRRPWVLGGWLWFLVALLPVSGVVQVGIQSMADRYTYLPLLGVELMILWTLREWITTPAVRQVWGAVAVAVLVAGAARTWNQLGVWQNSITLFDHAIAVTGQSYLAHNNRGMALAAVGRMDEALADYRRALAIAPTYPNANNNLGHALEQVGQPAEAIPYYRAAIAAKPDLLEAHNNLGNALSSVGELDAALAAYGVVLAREPNHVNSLNGRGVALAMKGRLDEARACFEHVLRREPEDLSAHTNLGNLCAMAGRRDEAVAHFRRALAGTPNDARTRYNLGNVLSELGQLDAAVENYRRAVQLAPVNPEAHAALGMALARLGRREEAIQSLQTALRQQPNFPQARAWLEQVTAGR